MIFIEPDAATSEHMWPEYCVANITVLFIFITIFFLKYLILSLVYVLVY